MGIFALLMEPTPQIHVIWYWFRNLSFSIPAVCFGVLALVFPHKFFVRYMRLNNYLADWLTDHGIELIALIESGGQLRHVLFTFVVGLLLTIFGSIGFYSTILDMISRPECFVILCSIGPNH